MIRSMTGYGKMQKIADGKKLTIEIKALNSKQLDLAMRLPADLKKMEFDLRNKLADTIQRGKVDFNVSIEDIDQKKAGRIDKQAAAAAYAQLQELAWDLQFKMPEDAASVLTRFPGFFATADTVFPDDFYEVLVSVSQEALKEFDAFRIQEGQVLLRDMLPRVGLILQLLDEVEPFENQRIDTLKNRLYKNAIEIADPAKFDPNRFEQELIYYIEKLDISEEKVRLKLHCEYFSESINDDYAGKKLGFITQEIGREINTLGSKANDAGMQRIVVQMKDELEKIKEQLFNVL
ncbi:MAG: YicC family protein [Bacteroidetes bacterium HGW-Bacteroidetes-1]|nr:MAG: YicC family protein [Bacteroidetes bacterium HGW-Bacteroidetes-1]